MGVKLTTNEFIRKANKKHDNKYNYSLVNYTKISNKIKIICPEHGVFEQEANTHLHSGGCTKCSYKNRNDSRKLNNDIFIKRANSVHDNKYNYSLVNYTKGYNKIKIICPEHGVFEQTSESHLQGHGCKSCGISIRSEKRKQNKQYFINKSLITHNGKYGYLLLNNDLDVKQKIMCPEHGIFEQLIKDHIHKKAGCPKCKQMALSLGIKEFVKRSHKLHNNKYDYSLVEYSNSYSNVEIICPEHGIFYQTPHSHLKGFGCKKCGMGSSKYENQIFDFIKNNLNINNIIENDRKILNGKELDIYLPDHKIGIEFNGLYWHSEKYKPTDFHFNKTELAKSKGVQLIHVFEDEWVYNPTIIKSIIKSKLGLITNKIYARKCIVKLISSKESRKFLNENHIQGNVNSPIRLGLYYNDELVSHMTFIKTRNGIKTKKISYELNRFCNKLNTTIIGGCSKLLNYFKTNFEYDEIISFADRRISNGNLYNILGFEKLHTTKPNYSYFNNITLKRQHRFNFRKDILIKEGYDSSKTAHEIMLNRKYYRIYDCGKIKFRLLKEV